ncbi:hypothetical protein CC2G_007659 [Coprinopsis cinerea AmutBmut pab1-1]|nr:hypothetical protein CC2G_007659 [Coprinopsis cinerea AmutBmut pab1-1]
MVQDALVTPGVTSTGAVDSIRSTAKSPLLNPQSHNIPKPAKAINDIEIYTVRIRAKPPPTGGRACPGETCLLARRTSSPGRGFTLSRWRRSGIKPYGDFGNLGSLVASQRREQCGKADLPS